MNKKRSRSKPSRQLLPAAAALTVAGILIGGAGAVIQLSAGQGSGGADIDTAAGYDPADYPPADRDAQAGRASRDDTRPTSGPAAEPTQATTKAGSCDASFYDEPQTTASGETFDPNAFTAAHTSLPFNSRVRVTNVANGRSVIVRINDRGPFTPGRCLDLSRAAFTAIASLGLGVIDVRYEVLAKEAT